MENYAALEVTNATLHLQNGFNIIGGTGNGREDCNNIFLDSSTIDIKHAAILYNATESTVKLMDLCSEENSFVDGVAVSPLVYIDVKDGVVLRFGDVSCRLVIKNFNEKPGNILDGDDTPDTSFIPCTPPRAFKHELVSKHFSSLEKSKDETISDSTADNESIVMPKKKNLNDDDFIFIPATQHIASPDNTTVLDSDDDNSFFCIETQSIFEDQQINKESENALGDVNEVDDIHATHTTSPSCSIQVDKEQTQFGIKIEDMKKHNDIVFDDEDSTDCDDDMIMQHYSLIDLKNSSKELPKSNKPTCHTHTEDSRDDKMMCDAIPDIIQKMCPKEMELTSITDSGKNNRISLNSIEDQDFNEADIATQIFFKPNTSKPIVVKKCTPSVSFPNNKEDVDISEMQTQIFFRPNVDVENDIHNAATQIFPKNDDMLKLQKSCSLKKNTPLYTPETKTINTFKLLLETPVMPFDLPSIEECNSGNINYNTKNKTQKMLFGDSSDEDDIQEKIPTKCNKNDQKINSCSKAKYVETVLENRKIHNKNMTNVSGRMTTRRSIKNYGNDDQKKSINPEGVEKNLNEAKINGRKRKADILETEVFHAIKEQKEIVPKCTTKLIAERRKSIILIEAPTMIIDKRKHSKANLTNTAEPVKSRNLRAKSPYAKRAKPSFNTSDKSCLKQLTTDEEHLARKHRIAKKKICFTLIDRIPYTSAIQKLGGELVENIEACNILCTTRAVRSVKFLSAISYGIPIVSPDWILDCEKKNSFDDPYDHILEDKDGEKRLGFVLKESLNLALRKKLFNNHTFIVMPDVVKPPPEDLNEIIKAASGRVLQKVPAKLKTFEHVFVVINTKNARYKQFKQDHPECKTTLAESILKAVISQNLNLLSN